MKSEPEILYVNCEDQLMSDSGRPVVHLEDYVALKRENKHLETWIDDLQSGMYINCVYCGHRYGPNSEASTKDFNLAMRKALEQHISECPKHPLSAAKKEIEKLKQQMAIMPVSYLEERKEKG